MGKRLRYPTPQAPALLPSLCSFAVSPKAPCVPHSLHRPPRPPCRHLPPDYGRHRFTGLPAAPSLPLFCSPLGNRRDPVNTGVKARPSSCGSYLPLSKRQSPHRDCLSPERWSSVPLPVSLPLGHPHLLQAHHGTHGASELRLSLPPGPSPVCALCLPCSSPWQPQGPYPPSGLCSSATFSVSPLTSSRSDSMSLCPFLCLDHHCVPSPSPHSRRQVQINLLMG